MIVNQSKRAACGQGRVASRRGWAPGQSGNPGGRPGGIAEVRELARTHIAEAIERLVKEMNDGETSHARIAAANALLDRGYGKPTQPIGGDPTGVPVEMTVETRVALARQAIAEAFREVAREDDDGKAEGAEKNRSGLIRASITLASKPSPLRWALIGAVTMMVTR
jgi:uncharacterized protein DUF5681